ncbi:thioredoxin family protein [Nioella nitratireducens]|uniref:thioredoxin family protein n=1 Tax=Nioella nitratireducens TaxID=1287720 RepID=UPI0008FD1337|nr:thioredoxin family protein [Nioella nitratireducens]
MKQLFYGLIGLAMGLALSAPAMAELDDAGLHVEPWIEDTFLDLREDLADANANGQRLLILFEQRGCIYCREMHETVFSRDDIAAMLTDDFFVVRLNLHGSLEVTDFDGTVMSERDIARRWGILFTPTLMFMPEEVSEDRTAPQAAVASMPGAFSGWTTFNLFTWVLGHGYDEEEGFQRYHARRLQEMGIIE